MTETISEQAMSAEQLDPMAQKVANASARLPQMQDGSPEDARALRAERGNPFAPPACELESIENLEISNREGTMALRIYKAKNQQVGQRPALIYYHGGGFVLGDIDQYDTVTQQLALLSNCIVISVDYRLAPTAKIKEIHEEGFLAYEWVRNHAGELGIDENRIAVGGDSAGGNLTVGVVFACKRHQFPVPAFQLLIYPSIDLAMRHGSVTEFADGYFLTKAGMSWFRSHYLDSPEQAFAPELDFLNCDLNHFPSTWLMTAGFDPLRDEGEAFARRLQQFGISTEHVCYTDMIHGFISFAGGISAGMQALRRMGEVLKLELKA